MTYASDRRMGARIERALHRVRSVFLEIPGVQLSLGEIARLTELETHLCKVLLSALEDLGFLQRREHGLYELQLPDVRRGSPD
jgi:DNA-binding IclR family transcriptional regulator